MLNYSTLLKSNLITLFVSCIFTQALIAQCATNQNDYYFFIDNHSYALVNEAKNWAEAANCAVEMGGYLTEINSQAEQESIYNAIVESGLSETYTLVNDGGEIAYVWIGASDLAEEGTWLWDGNGDDEGVNFWNGQGAAAANDGSPVNNLYNNWGGASKDTLQEPDNYQGQHCAAIGLAGWPAWEPGFYGVAGEWNDINANNKIFYIVEFDCLFNPGDIQATICGSYTGPSGTVYTEAGTYFELLPVEGICDSLFTIELTNKNTTATIDENACYSYTTPSGNYTYTENGTYMDTILNSVFCDSIITINLTFNNSSNTISEDACGSYTVPSGNYTYTENGIYMDTIPNAAGCDSILTIYLSLNNTESLITETACNYYLLSNETLISESGIYIDTLTNAAGCDSIVTIDLTIHSVDTSFEVVNENTLIANATDVEYQWINCDGEPLEGETNQEYELGALIGGFAVVIDNNGCIDTSECYEYAVIGNGLENNILINNLSLFPSPNNSNFTIDLKEVFKEIDISICNIKGQVVFENKYTFSNLINIYTPLASGMYFVNIEFDGFSRTMKLVRK